MLIYGINRDGGWNSQIMRYYSLNNGKVELNFYYILKQNYFTDKKTLDSTSVLQTCFQIDLEI